MHSLSSLPSKKRELRNLPLDDRLAVPRISLFTWLSALVWSNGCWERPQFLKVRHGVYKVTERKKIKGCLWQKKKKFIGKIASGSVPVIFIGLEYFPVHFVKMSQKNSYSNGVTQIFRANTLYAWTWNNCQIIRAQLRSVFVNQRWQGKHNSLKI